MSQENNYKKYLKYKAKYFALKNQKGGVICPKCGKEPCECLPFINIEIIKQIIEQSFDSSYTGVISLAAIPQFRKTIIENLGDIIEILKAKEPLFKTLIDENWGHSKDEDWKKFTNLCELLTFQDKIPDWIKIKYNKLTNKMKLFILKLISLGTTENGLNYIASYNEIQFNELMDFINKYKTTETFALKAFQYKWTREQIIKYIDLCKRGVSEDILYYLNDGFYKYDDEMKNEIIKTSIIYPKLKPLIIIDIVRNKMNDKQKEEFRRISIRYPELEPLIIIDIVRKKMNDEQIMSYLTFINRIPPKISMPVDKFMEDIYPLSDVDKDNFLYELIAEYEEAEWRSHEAEYGEHHHRRQHPDLYPASYQSS
jgi:hypothetical protein